MKRPSNSALFALLPVLVMTPGCGVWEIAAGASGGWTVPASMDPPDTAAFIGSTLLPQGGPVALSGSVVAEAESPLWRACVSFDIAVALLGELSEGWGGEKSRREGGWSFRAYIGSWRWDRSDNGSGMCRGFLVTYAPFSAGGAFFGVEWSWLDDVTDDGGAAFGILTAGFYF